MSSVLAMAKDLVLAQIRAGNLSADAMQTLLQDTYAQLMALKAQEEGSSPSSTDEDAVVPTSVAWKKSLTKHAVVCLECGESFKQLSRRHLKIHDLDQRAYRAKYGIPRTQPLAAKVVTAQRKQIVQQSRPWEKAPTYLQAQERKAVGAARATTTHRSPRHPPAAR
jgi:predicted transcriptional regulator